MYVPGLFAKFGARGGTALKHRILIVMGSMRPGSRTALVSRLAKMAVEACGMEVDMLDPRETALSFPGETDHETHKEAIRKRVGQASGAVFVTPEYDGSISAILKLMIEHFGYPSDLSGKPAAIVGCAGGRIGAIKAIEHLRSLLNHTGVFVMPHAYSIPQVFKVFDDDDQCTDDTVTAGIAVVIKQLQDHLDR